MTVAGGGQQQSAALHALQASGAAAVSVGGLGHHGPAAVGAAIVNGSSAVKPALTPASDSNSVTSPSVTVLAASTVPHAHETRRISFVINSTAADDNESVTSSQTTLAVQASIILTLHKQRH